MRQAVFDTQWLLADDGTLQGVCLGYDRCGEHEWGISELEAYLGVPRPEFRIGPADRLIHNADYLQLHEYSRKPRDKRRKAYPAALLLCRRPSPWDEPRSGQALATSCNAELYFEPGDKHHLPRYDLAAAWGEKEFAVHVRGAENIARLRELRAAAQRGDLLLTSSGSGWLDCHGISLVILSRMSKDDVRKVTERDEAYRELQLAARATGIEDVLRAAGKKWYALKPGWRDARKQHVDFFLNPRDQSHHASGWFTVEELQQWARDEGPVMVDKEMQRFDSSEEGHAICVKVCSRLQQHGVKLRNVPHLAWMDADKKVMGILLHTHHESEERLASGTYAVEDLLQRYPQLQTEEAAS